MCCGRISDRATQVLRNANGRFPPHISAFQPICGGATAVPSNFMCCGRFPTAPHKTLLTKMIKTAVSHPTPQPLSQFVEGQRPFHPILCAVASLRPCHTSVEKMQTAVSHPTSQPFSQFVEGQRPFHPILCAVAGFRSRHTSVEKMETAVSTNFGLRIVQE